MLDYGNVIKRGLDYLVVPATADILIVLALFKQHQYTKALFRNLLILTSSLFKNNLPFRQVLTQEPWVLNEEIGEQVLSALCRAISDNSSRSRLPLAQRKYMNVKLFGSCFASDFPLPGSFLEHRTTRKTMSSASPEVDCARKFFSDFIARLMAGDHFVYKPTVREVPRGPDDYDDSVPPTLSVGDVLPFIETCVARERKGPTYGKGAWLTPLVPQLRPDVAAFLTAGSSYPGGSPPGTIRPAAPEPEIVAVSEDSASEDDVEVVAWGHVGRADDDVEVVDVLDPDCSPASSSPEECPEPLPRRRGFTNFL